MLIKQELHCHACNRYVQFEVDIDQDGDYTIPCPNCGHEHYRIIKDKRITSRRWASSVAIQVTWAATSTTSMDSGTVAQPWMYYGSSGTATTTAC